MKDIPKKIWIFWYQGFYGCPGFVKKCFMSWKIRNPNYEVTFLDHKSIVNYIDIPQYFNIDRDDITYQKYSNYVRLALLDKFGGVWVDANIYCLKGLDKWVTVHHTTSGIFMFENSFDDRLIANWFIMARPNHYLIQRWITAYCNYFKRNTLKNTFTKYGIRIRKIIRKRRNQNIQQTKVWFSFIVRKAFKVCPYLVMHYLFNSLYMSDNVFAKIWNSTKKMSACDFDVRCQEMHGRNFESFMTKFKRDQIHMLKLSQKVDLYDSFYKNYMRIIRNDYKLLTKDGANTQSIAHNDDF